MKSPDWKAYHEFLRASVDALVNREIGPAERARLADEILAVAVAARSMLDIADRVVSLEIATWYTVETMEMPLSPWREHSDHSDHHCARACASDIVSQEAAHASRVKCWSDDEVLETFVAKHTRIV